MDLDQLEAFSLASDRDAQIGNLIPGTEVFYYYSCLLAQQRGDLDRVDDLVTTWRKRHGRSSRLETIENRQLILRLGDKTGDVCEELRRRLYLDFDHQREVELARGAHPSALDARTLDPARLTAEARKNYPGQATGFTDRGLWRLLDEENLDPSTRHHMLSRLTRPDHPRLVDHIAEDMSARKTEFGAIGIHRALLPDQLERLATRVPALRHHPSWVDCRLVHLQPAIDDDWEGDLEVRRDMLDRYWREVSALGPAFNSLKAHLLYHRLDVGRSLGVYPFELFRAYLRLPRQVSYLARTLRKASRDEHVAHLGASYQHATLLPPVGDDEQLVRDYLAELLRDEDDVGELGALLDASVLRTWFATLKILAGKGDLERWHEMLNDSSVYAALKDRVDIDLVPQNKKRYAPDEPVVIAARIKNVKTLVINVFEINTFNHALRHQREPDTAIDLDGLVASESTVHQFDEPPFRSVRREFELPTLMGPGTFVVELIGGGKSSRALIRKGALRHTARLGAAGHVLAIFDEANEPVMDASISFGGTHISADERGEITIPFTSSPRTLSATLRAGDRTEVIKLYHQAESYRLTAGIAIERESLIVGNTAEVLVRPELTVSNTPIDISLLEEPTLVIETTNRRGVSARREIRELELSGTGELVADFRVPENLSSVRVTLEGSVRSLTARTDVELADSTSFAINAIDNTPHTSALHLGRARDGYVLYALGKTGEPRADIAINLAFHHHEFSDRTDITLQTDENGRVELGPLAGVARLEATSPGGVGGSWVPELDHCSYPRAIHVAAGDAVRIPVPASARASVLEVRRGNFVADAAAAARHERGALVLEGLPAGDYDVFLDDSGARIAVRVVPGPRRRGWLLGNRRHLQQTSSALATIESADVDGSNLTARVAGHGKRARLHVVATRYAAERSLWHSIGRRVVARAPGGWEVELPASFYVSGRDLGDEYRYILERRMADKIPGAAVSRPGLLLNPWARQATSSTTLDVMASSAYAAAGPMGRAASAPPPSPKPSAIGGSAGSFANVDFLASGAVLLANLPIPADGQVSVPRADLGSASAVRLLLVDDEIAISREVGLDEPVDTHRDLRQDEALDPAIDVSEVRQISELLTGNELTVRDIASSTVDVVDTIGRVHQLLCSLSGNTTLAEFGFIARWHGIEEAERFELYSRHACHELHLFLFFKDPSYFGRVIKPYLADKHHKTFLDHFFTEASLERYLAPWPYGRLNVLERILLAGRHPDLDAPTRRRIRDRFELSPRDLTREQYLFDAVVGGGALDTGDSLGFGAAKDKAKEAKKRSRRARAGGAMPPPPQSAPPAGMIAKSAVMEDYDDESEMAPPMEAAASLEDSFGEGGDGDSRDLARRESQRQLYRAPEKTQEWAENNYYRLRPDQCGPDLVANSGFWLDYAERDTTVPFLSPRFTEATSSFTDMMAALAVLDLPMSPGKHDASYDGARMQLRADSAAIVFHKEIVPVEPSPERVPVLVSQNYFRADDRYRWEGGEQLDKYVTGEMLIQVVYLCQVVLTNPTSSPKRLQLLLQIPEGAIAVAGGYPTRGEPTELAPYGTAAIEYSFYFPHPGQFPHYPAKVTLDEQLIASAEAGSLDVVATLTDLDHESWAHVSQHGSDDEVLAFLGRTNLARIDLDKIAWRMRDRSMFEKTLAVLEQSRVYHSTLWSYSLHHGAVARVAQYLRHADQLLASCGPNLSAIGLESEPVARGWYEHLEYAPLVNARAHRLGGRLQIANSALETQYRSFLERLAHMARLGDDEWLEVAYYLFVQDRVADALTAFDRVSDTATGVQVDYMRAFAHLARHELDAARSLATANASHGVERWRKQFEAMLAAIARASGADPIVTDADSQRQAQDQLAATQASFEVEIENSGDRSSVLVTYQRLASCQVSYYLMDIELLFSRQPFLRENTDRFSLIRPNRTEALALPPDRTEIRFDIPAELRGTNVVIEVEAAGSRRAIVHYAHRLSVQLIAPYGQVRVGEDGTGRPVAGTYVKVYSRSQGGDVEFYKDGYTDLTGSFDYASVSTDTLGGVERFALLIFDPERGSVIREAEPPPR